MSVSQDEFPPASLDNTFSENELMKNPPSVLKECDVVRIQRAYNLSSVVLRAPLATERPTDARCGEIVVYESLFASGLRECVPTLIATMATHFSISPGQLSPTVWRVLMATQNFAEFYRINIGVKEVLYGYYFMKLPGDIDRYSLHPRRNCPLVIDIHMDSKDLSKDQWRKKYMFMTVGHSMGFPTTWRRADVRAKSKTEGTVGRAGASKILARPLQYRFVEFLTSRFGLEGSTIWGFDMSNSHWRSVTDAYSEFLAASGKLLEANPSISVHTLPDSGDELQCIEVPSVVKRKADGNTATSSAARRPKFSHRDTTVVTTTSQVGNLTCTEAALAAEELKSKILSHNLASLVTDASTSSDEAYADLLKVMSTFPFR
ncbi:uncharacterized protein LOC110229406 isoform X2 [Arabidopsis lyrata subsp. lyrata]|nr:uncharacterized protein LOC110229406 isoform X2 [Arabidopsis lyrata subsp. lyrata]|eukprot:XP_020885144.1 uncharacterized protein LOC110229406 isoform X2 [Arabidopsis lyrata subsp. lyrata]